MYRYAPPIGLAATVTVGLLLLMQALIHLDELRFEEPTPTVPIDFVRIIEEAPPPPKQVETRPEVVEPPPPVTIVGPEVETDGGGYVDPEVRVDPPGPPTSIAGTGMATPVVEPAAVYPQRCASRGLEGYVLVRYDVDEIGATQNIQVLESNPDCFERAAAASVQRYRYRPAEANGRPVPVRGLLKRITFRLDG